MIGIIDCGMGNIYSVYNSFEFIGQEVHVCTDPREVANWERIVLPGVGAFDDCMRCLRERGFIEVLNKAVFIDKKPILGICLGMQVMARKGFEGGEHEGLGWFNAEVIRIPDESELRIPHIGWNEVHYRAESALFSHLPGKPDFYFVHSYYMKCNDPDDVEATFDYGGNYTASVKKKNIFAVQFHPEKSQDYGLQVLKNFVTWKP